MSPTLAVVPDPESNGHGGDLEAELLRLLSQAALARSNEDAQRYEGIARFLAGLDRKADASVEDLRKIRAALATVAEEQARTSAAITRMGVQLQVVERAARDDDERHGQIVAALARIEHRESQHRTKLDSITEEVTEVKAAHGGWLAVGSFMDRHRKLASTVAFLVLLGFQIFHLLRK